MGSTMPLTPKDLRRIPGEDMGHKSQFRGTTPRRAPRWAWQRRVVPRRSWGVDVLFSRPGREDGPNRTSRWSRRRSPLNSGKFAVFARKKGPYPVRVWPENACHTWPSFVGVRWAREDSNLRPLECESSALTAELRARRPPRRAGCTGHYSRHRAGRQTAAPARPGPTQAGPDAIATRGGLRPHLAPPASGNPLPRQATATPCPGS